MPERERPELEKQNLLLDLGEDLSVFEEEELLREWKRIGSIFWSFQPPVEIATLTSSPTLMAFPPQPGKRTRSPAFTDMGMILPSLSRAPGPTEMTVASGNGWDVADVGRKMPVAVFWMRGKAFSGPRLARLESECLTVSALNRWTRTRSRRGTRDLMDLNVADCKRIGIG